MTKVAIVTGAGQGIGFAIAKRLHEDGFKVGILDYNAETAQKAVDAISSEDTVAVVANVAKRDEVFAAFDNVIAGLGRLGLSLLLFGLYLFGFAGSGFLLGLSCLSVVGLGR